MRKKIVITLLALVMILSLAGCAKKTCVHISVDGIGDYVVTQISGGTVNYSVKESDIEVTVKDEGVYTFGIKGEDGKEYSIELSYYDGKADVYSEDNITINFDVK